MTEERTIYNLTPDHDDKAPIRRGRRPSEGTGSNRPMLRLSDDLVARLHARYGQNCQLATAVRLALIELLKIEGGEL